MTRREFSIAVAGSIAVAPSVSGSNSPVVILTAIAGARLPDALAIRTSSPEILREGLWELRTYRSAASGLATQLAEIFPQHGIRPVLSRTESEDLTYLIPFEDLSSRDRAWTLLNADPLWLGARSRFESYRFGLYRAL